MTLEKKRRRRRRSEGNYWVRDEEAMTALLEMEEAEAGVEEEVLWLCIQTLKTCLLTPISLQKPSISSSCSFLCILHPIFSAKLNILSFCSAENLVLIRFLPLRSESCDSKEAMRPNPNPVGMGSMPPPSRILR